MSRPVEVDLPHQLGRAGAKQRIEGGFGKLAGYVPGGHVTEHRWDGDTLHFVVEGMGQRVAVRLDVADNNVHAVFELPGLLAMFAEPLRAKLEKDGPKLLA
ncbi:polyhydroxyalkanoic acid system family protein [Sphingomonas sp. DT-51]|uniref:polyhydroxyalkanoic acid system family protein n=1 Tax=Sphingomonas sp. DT-51 TaxID=3396165 RepID=UPI003F1A99ED